MAYVESHQEVGQHPKLLRLARTLGISKAAAVGHLHYLWWWALDYAPDGNIVGYDELDIAVGAQWEGDPAEFVQALIGAGGAKAGWLEDREDGWFVHDWPEFGGKLHAKRQASIKANHVQHHVNKSSYAPDCPFCRSGRTPNGLRSDSESAPNGVRTASGRTPDDLRSDSREEKSREEKKTLGDADASREVDRQQRFSVLADVCGLDLSKLTRNERGRLNDAEKQLREVGADPEEIKAKAAAYRERFSDAALTPQALANNWAQLEVSKSRGSPRRRDFCDECPGDRRHLPDCPRYERMREVV